MNGDLHRAKDHLYCFFSYNGYPYAIIQAGSEGGGRRKLEMSRVRNPSGHHPSDMCAGGLTSKLHSGQG